MKALNAKNDFAKKTMIIFLMAIFFVGLATFSCSEFLTINYGNVVFFDAGGTLKSLTGGANILQQLILKLQETLY